MGSLPPLLLRVEVVPIVLHRRYALAMRLGWVLALAAPLLGGCKDGGTGGDAGSEGGGTVCQASGIVSAVFPLPATMTPSAVASDGNDNVYVAGLFTGTVTVGTTSLVADGPNDMFVVVFDTKGNVARAARYGSDSYDDPAPALVVDAAGNVYLSGFFDDTLDFGNGVAPLVAIDVDAFVVRFDPSGNAVWADRFGLGGAEAGAIALAPNGDPVIAGTSHGTIVLGPTTWPAFDALDSQPYVAHLSAVDGSVTWSAASGGTLDAAKMQVAVDANGKTYIAGECLSGESSWGPPPTGLDCTFRLAFDAGGNPLWSRFDSGGQPVSIELDHDGHVVVGERFFDQVTTDDGHVFTGSGWVLSLLTHPIDGSVISGAVGDNFFYSGASDPAQAIHYVVGDWTYAGHLGSFSFPNDLGGSELFIGAIDATSTFVWARELGAGTTSAQVVHVLANGSIAVAGSTDTAFTTEGGNVPAGSFVLVVAPPVCNGGDASLADAGASSGKLRDAEPVSDVTPAACPNDSSGAINGAACPVAMGCNYGTVCCFCTPTVCGQEPTLWTCDDLANPDPTCPSTPPGPATACATVGTQCNYCLAGGRFYATCTAAGWFTGYAQIVCN
jgi:hypothetical protein